MGLPPLERTWGLQVGTDVWERRRVGTHQPAQVLEAHVQLVPTAHLPAVGAVDVICGDTRGKDFAGLLLPGRGTP